MSDSNSNSNSDNHQTDATSSSTTKLPSPSAIETTPSASNMPAKLQIPESAIPHLESALLKSAVGMTAGAVLGVVFFRGGKGWRLASSVGAGLGVALGSSAERYWAKPDAPPRSLFKVDGLF